MEGPQKSYRETRQRVRQIAKLTKSTEVVNITLYEIGLVELSRPGGSIDNNACSNRTTVAAKEMGRSNGSSVKRNALPAP